MPGERPKSSPNLPGGGARFGPYQLDSRIAVGGTAEVYLAHPIDPAAQPRKVVVKRLLPNFAADPEGRTMFEREARLHACVQHPNVVEVFGSGMSADGEPYLAMEFIDGVDGYRLLRRLRQENELLPLGVAVHIAHEVLEALESVHAATDSGGAALGIIHRDVTPSNLYLSQEGRVKLGDFGIARSTARQTLRNEASAVLKGKFAYLAPEQVAGEPFDHRADLFSLATVLAEMLLGKPLFPGGGQLAVLLAIRDCRIDALHEIDGRLPKGLMPVLEKALAREPDHRYASARLFADALVPFCASDDAATLDLSLRVRWVQASPSVDAMSAVRESMRSMRAVTPPPASQEQLQAQIVARLRHPSGRLREQIPAQPVTVPVMSAVSVKPGTAATSVATPALPLKSRASVSVPTPVLDDLDPDSSDFNRKTGEYEPMPSYALTASGERLGPWTFARLMEALATAQIGRGDRLDYMGRGFAPIETIDELERFLPARTATTGTMDGPGMPDYRDSLSPTSDGIPAMLTVLLRLLEARETGVLFVERESDETGQALRKEMYFIGGKLNHVASTSTSELLGEFLVRRGTLAREELDLALAVLPKYNGRMGDTLIALGLAGPVDIFRAIREQGRDRVADSFTWKRGAASFYRGQKAPHVEFPLDLDLPPLLLAGIEAAHPAEAPLTLFRERLERFIGPAANDRGRLRQVTWPPAIARVLQLAQPPKSLKELLRAAARDGTGDAADALRAVELLLAARLLEWK
jgi:serine/threonine-protein kinase